MKRIVVLSGAGISAESGLQTFRGVDGLWEGHRADVRGHRQTSEHRRARGGRGPTRVSREPSYLTNQSPAQAGSLGRERVARCEEFLGSLEPKNDRQAHRFARARALSSTPAHGRTALGVATLSARRRPSSARCHSGSGDVSTSRTTPRDMHVCSCSRQPAFRPNAEVDPICWTVGGPVCTGTGEQTWDSKIRERGFILPRKGGGFDLWSTVYNDARSPNRFLGHATSSPTIPRSWRSIRWSSEVATTPPSTTPTNTALEGLDLARGPFKGSDPLA